MSNKSINELFDETKQKMNGHTMLYYFHLSNLCVTADPMALLSSTVKIDNKDFNLEDVATVSIPNDKQFAVLPKDKEYLAPIIKAIKLEHPEFEIEEIEADIEVLSDNFEVFVDDEGVFNVVGEQAEYIVNSTNFDDVESLNYFQRILRKKGIIDMLEEEGIKDGDIVRMADVEFEYYR